MKTLNNYIYKFTHKLYGIAMQLHVLVFVGVLLLSTTNKTQAVLSPINHQSKVGNTWAAHDSILINSSLISDFGCDTAHIYRIFNKVHLQLNKDLCFRDSFTVSVDIRIRYGNKAVYTSYKDTTLLVSYNSRSGAEFTDKNTWAFEGSLPMSVEIMSFTANPNTTEVLSLVNLEVERQVEWYPFIDVTQLQKKCLLTVSGSATANNEIDIQWLWMTKDMPLCTLTTIEIAEEYELEWVFVDDYAERVSGAITYQSGTMATPDFTNNATRVLIKPDGPVNHYLQNIVFEHGYVFYRVRPIYKHRDYIDHRVNGDWSYGDYTSGSLLQASFHISNDHEPLKNWQYISSFAEEGKRKEVVSYMDGTMRKRQIVTQNNSDQMSVVGETIYDSLGRPTIEVLPVPSFSNTLGYFFNFNLNTAGNPFSEKDFDVFDTIKCSLNKPNAMSIYSGAGKYYSNQNPRSTNAITDYHAYVPDAMGYPYTQVEYTTDNTGRINRQAGPGPEHILGSGHETHFLYSKPSQAELDRIFGSNVGDANRYKKNITEDANGQVSISYLNPKGQVVATALAGESPDNVQQLASYSSSPYDNNEDLALNKSVHIFDSTSKFEDGKIMMSRDFTATAGSVYKFYYRLKAPRKALCVADNECFYGVYKLNFELTDGCGNNLYNMQRKLSFDPSYEDSICGHYPKDTVFNTGSGLPAGAVYNNQWIEFTLPKGNYHVDLTAAVDLDAADAYTEMMLRRNKCILNEEYFDSVFLATADTMQCEQADTPTCAKCIERLGSYAAFKDAWFDGLVIANEDSTQELLACKNEYYEQTRLCDEICDTLETPCEDYYSAMLLDVSPSGQYFKIKTILPTGATDSIVVPDLSEWLNVGKQSIYSDPAFGLAEMTVEIGNEVVKVKTLSEEEFIKYFLPEWADTLVKKHPEYCQYLVCLAQNDTSSFVDSFMDEYDCHEAYTNGFFNPLAMSGLPFASGSMYDPVFAGIYANAERRDSLIDLFTDWRMRMRDDAHAIYLNIYQAAFLPTVYDTTYAHLIDTLNSRIAEANGNCSPCNIQVLQSFKAIYLTIRQGFMDRERDRCEPDTAKKVRTWKRKIYTPLSDIMVRDEVRGKTLYELSIDAKIAMKAKAESSCENYAHYWMQKLAGCFPGGYDYYDSLALADSLVAVCKRGADERNPWGASTVSNFWLQKATPVNKSFHDVLKTWLSGSRFAAGICDEFLIEFPKPYNHDYWDASGNLLNTLDLPDTNTSNVYDACTCKQFDELRNKYKNDATVCTTKSFAVYVNKEYGTQFTDEMLNYYDLLCHPPGHGGTDGCSLNDTMPKTPLSAGSPHADARFDKAYVLNWLRKKAVFLPPAFKCAKTCLSCEDILKAAKDFTAYFGKPDTSYQDMVLFASFTNQRYGFNLTYHDYIDVLQGCDTAFKVMYGYKYYDASTFGKFPLFDPLMTMPGPDCKCNKLLQLWAIYTQNNIGASGKSFTEYVTEKLGFTIPFEPTAVTISDLINQCGGMNDTLDLKCVESIKCYCGAHTIINEVPCVGYLCSNDPPTSPESVTTWKLNLCAYTERVRTQKNCSNLTPCEEVGAELDQYYENTRAYAEAAMETLYEHDFTVFEYKIPETDGTDSVKMRIICNQPTTVATDFFEVVDDMFSTDSAKLDYKFDLRHTASYAFGSLATMTRPEVVCNTCDTNGLTPNPYYVWMRKGLYDYGASPGDTNNLYKGLDIFMGPDTIYSTCKVHFDSIFTRSLDSLVHVYDLQPTGVRHVDGSQTFTVKMTKLNNDVITVTGYATCMPIAECCPPRALRLCNEPMVITLAEDTPSCKAYVRARALAEAEKAYQNYIDSVRIAFKSSYLGWAYKYMMDSIQFKMKWNERLHHFTLYYYDQAGNLLQTVPPNGVAFLTQAQVESLAVKRADARYYPGEYDPSNSFYTFTEPSHTFKTQYRYTSLNQVIWQTTPDGGQTLYWYDLLGRIVISQDADQASSTIYNTNNYASYTFYDALGRITEVGRVNKSNTALYALWGSVNSYKDVYYPFIQSGTRDQITQTYYDINTMIAGIGGTGNGKFVQQNLRNRVSAMVTKGTPTSAPNNGTFYSYDLHGNVSSLLQYNKSLADPAHQYKQINYYYDLISGKVNSVSYQGGKSDAMHHVYTYDADNRITQVQTSRDSVIWVTDAQYKYYLHGPLARTELMTERKLQGVDYYYTLQGWLKGVNSAKMSPNNDPGHDGASGSSNPNLGFAPDVYGFELSYYLADGTQHKDYTEIGNITSSSRPYTQYGSSSGLAAGSPNLYNGNIRSMTTAIEPFMQSGASPLAFAYNYDQLNRLQSADAYKNLNMSTNEWNSSGKLPMWHNRFTYDANGNILTQVRHSQGIVPAGSIVVAMDSLQYEYTSGSNKLLRIRDLTSLTNYYTDDIDDQIYGNYQYLANGNLDRDNLSGSCHILWNIYGKITSITNQCRGNRPDLAYEYGPDGNRVTKIVKPKDINEPWEYTYYVRDAQGNVMATYTQLTDKKIDFDNITFNTLNDSIIAKHGAASWRGFMSSTAAISTPYFKNDLIDFIQSSSMGATFLDKWTLAQVITDHPTLITNAWATYTYSARFLTMKSYIGRSQYTTDMLMGICPDLMEQVVSLYTASFESLLSGIDATAYANYMAWKAAPTGTAQAWLCGNVSTASLKACIDGLSNGDFDALLSSLSTSTTAQAWIDLTYSVTQKSECLDAAGHSTWLAAIYAQYSTTDWKAYWTTTNPPSYYDTLLTHFKLQVGYVQDIYGYYTKEDYLLYVKDYYGQAYYDTLVKHFFVASRHYKMVFAAKEFYIYGSSRLGSINANYKLRTTEFDATYSLNGTFTSKTNIKDTIFEAHYKYKTLVRGQRQYELSNHLGNVLAVISDQWKTNCLEAGSPGEYTYTFLNYQATVVQATDYSAFGAPLPGRTYVLSASFKSRFGFNRKESDGEVSGDGNFVDYGMRANDTRLGRFFSVDPLTKKYPELTPYQFASNRPIDGIDLDGLEYATYLIVVDFTTGYVTSISVNTDYELKDPNTQGPGIKYVYYSAADGKEVPGLGRFQKNLYGIYQGGNNPQLPVDPKTGKFLKYTENRDSYSLPPIDETDANAKQHDLDYDKKNLKGFKGIMSKASSQANKDYIARAKVTIKKYEKGENDNITGKPVTKATADAADFGRYGFSVAENIKSPKQENRTPEQQREQSSPKY